MKTGSTDAALIQFRSHATLPLVFRTYKRASPRGQMLHTVRQWCRACSFVPPVASMAMPARIVMVQLASWALVGQLASSEVMAQAYPTRSIRVVSPFAPGGGSDILARLVAEKLTAGLKQQAYVENRGGGGGRAGTDYVAKAAPDGHTLLVTGSGSMILATAMYEKLSYNVQRDFAPITMLVLSPALLVMHPTVPVRSVRELIVLCHSKPGLLNYASPGTGAMGHLAGELFQSMAKVKMTHVPYKGTAPGLLSVVSGETDLAFSNFLPAVPAVKAGRLRAIAVTSARRSAVLPEVATVAESGVPGYDAASYYGVLAPAATPRPIVDILNVTLAKELQSPDTRKSLEADGSALLASTPGEMARLIRVETQRWSSIIKAANIKAE